MAVRRRYLAAIVPVALALVGFGIASSGALARGSAPAAALQTGNANVIRVSAMGQVSVAPDQATITVGVQTHASTAQEALSKNADAMTAVIAAIKGQGVQASHLQTSGLSIWYDDQKGQYTASHQITVTLDDITKVGPVLDASVAAGANNSWGVSFGLKDPSAAQAGALKAAVSTARVHADAIASALNVTITGVRSASEPTYTTQPVNYAPVAAGASPSAPTPVQPGQLTVTASIALVYTF
jgi:uncharacterized protein YggE